MEPARQMRGYGLALGLVILVSALALPFRSLTDPDNLALIYLTAVVIAAARLGIGPAVLTSILSVAAFNFVFTRPYYRFNFYDSHYYFTFAFMLVTSLIVGSLTAQLSRHAQLARKEEQETHLLYDLTRGLSSVRGVKAMSEVAIRHLEPAFDSQVQIWLRAPGDDPLSLTLWPLDTEADTTERGAVQWVSRNGQIAGRQMLTLPSVRGLYLPLRADNEILGVLGFLPLQADRRFSQAEKLAFETVSGLIANALQHTRRADEAELSRIDTENERLRNVLLASLSHDLKTPLTVMNGSVSTLLKMRKKLPREAFDELTGLWGQLNHLQKFVSNLLKMAAITSGQLKLNFQPYLIQEIVGAALMRIEAQKGMRQIRTVVTGQLPMIEIDGALIEQVLINLLDNAISHTPPDGIITLALEKQTGGIQVRVSDNGEGLKTGQEEQIFEKFQRLQSKSSDRHNDGAGLGLAICRGIVHAHGGTIHAKNNVNTDGASFIFTLPTSVEKEPT